MNDICNSSKDNMRTCINIKSKKIPDIQCKSNAIFGDYCSKHWKHPSRFTLKHDIVDYTRAEKNAINKIKMAWKHHSSYISLFNQGPCINLRDKSTNETEIFSLESVSSIIKLYYFSIVDSKGNLWIFDIRSLAQMISLGTLSVNPYTRSVLLPSTIKKILRRIQWLRSRGYVTLYPTGTDFTSEQIWMQKILDVCIRIESFGFHVSYEWFNGMSLENHVEYYKTLYNLWNYKLGLSLEQQNAIVPSSVKLFTVNNKKTYSKNWWEKTNLQLINTLITSSSDKELQRLGATYCMMGFVNIHKDAAEAFPWLHDYIMNAF